MRRPRIELAKAGRVGRGCRIRSFPFLCIPIVTATWRSAPRARHGGGDRRGGLSAPAAGDHGAAGFAPRLSAIAARPWCWSVTAIGNPAGAVAGNCRRRFPARGWSSFPTAGIVDARAAAGRDQGAGRVDAGVTGRCFMTSALDLIGNTPMVELTGFDTGPCRLFLKLESANPGGSIKDRIARSMIEAAEARRPAEARRHDRRGDRRQHRPGPGAGRRAQGLRLVLVVPDKMAREKILHLRPWASRCASPAPTSARAIPNTTRTWPRRIAQRMPGAFFINQFANPANPLAHETTHRPGDLRADGAATSTPSWSASAPAAR